MVRQALKSSRQGEHVSLSWWMTVGTGGESGTREWCGLPERRDGEGVVGAAARCGPLSLGGRLRWLEGVGEAGGP